MDVQLIHNGNERSWNSHQMPYCIYELEVMIHDSHCFDRDLEDVNIPTIKLARMRTLENYQETRIHLDAPGRKYRAGVVYCR